MPILTAFGGTSGRQFMFGGGALGPPTEVSFLVVAGGGSGGYGSGGGAGGYRSAWNGETSGGGGAAESNHPVTTGVAYTVTIGAGGATSPTEGAQGTSSVFDTITTVGGGRGRDYPPPGNLRPGGPGGSGGAGKSGDGPVGTSPGGTGTANQGYPGGANIGTGGPGGTSGGGGGGAGGAGQNGDAYNAPVSPGDPGPGQASTITGSSVTRGRGGTSRFWAYVAPDGANFGGGGSSSTSVPATNADSGVVILRFAGSTPTIGAGLTYSEATVGGDTVLTFTAGTDTITW